MVCATAFFSCNQSVKENHSKTVGSVKEDEEQNIDISVDKIVKDASNVTYVVDSKFNSENINGIVYLGIFKNDNICALKADGTVMIISSNGKVVGSFATKVDGKTSSIAVDKADNIYVMSTLLEKKVNKIRGVERTRTLIKGIECTVFNKEGKQQNKFELSGLKSATGARVANNKLMVADSKNKMIGLFDTQTGILASKIKEDIRTCCGILDFSVNDKNQILVANVGSYRVQGYDFDGNCVLAFGQRGVSVNDFLGCCNPVSVAYLSNGAIVTVEKDPTRVKIYSKEGAKQISGIEELVKGCSYIPMIVDSKDNLYLASSKKGMIKCISSN